MPLHITRYGATVKSHARAKTLRKSMTRAENMLWQRVRRKQIGGVRIRRQHPFLTYIFDFYIPEFKLAIELDGEIHASPEQQYHDANRSQMVFEFGVHVIRIQNSEIENDIDEVVKGLKELVEALKVSM